MGAIRTRLTLIAALCAALYAITGCAGNLPPSSAPASPTSGAAPTTIRYGAPTGVALPTSIAAEEKGFFAKENLKVEPNYTNGVGAINDALAAGNLDMGVVDPSSSTLAILKGARIILVSGYENTFVDSNGRPWESTYMVVRSGEGIHKLTDLKGKKVAIFDLASYNNLALRAQMLTNQIDPDKDMTIVPVELQQMPAALTQKMVDAANVNADGYYQLKQNGGIDVIATHTALVGIDMDLSCALAVNTDFYRKNPDAVTHFVRALLQARMWLADDVAQSAGKNLMDVVGRSMKYSPERVKSFYETRGGYYGKELDRVNLLDAPTRVINRSFEILKINGLIKPDTPVAYEQVVNLDPLKQAYESLGLKWDDSKH